MQQNNIVSLDAINAACAGYHDFINTSHLPQACKDAIFTEFTRYMSRIFVVAKQVEGKPLIQKEQDRPLPTFGQLEHSLHLSAAHTRVFIKNNSLFDPKDVSNPNPLHQPHLAREIISRATEHAIEEAARLIEIDAAAVANETNSSDRKSNPPTRYRSALPYKIKRL